MPCGYRAVVGNEKRSSQSGDEVDARHAGRFYDKDMPIEQAGMEMSKPGLPDLRRRKHSVELPDEADQQRE